MGTRPLGCEETEASIRAVQRNPGSLVWYAPGAVVEHRVTAQRSTWEYFQRRCWAEGLSKASVRRLSQEPLGTERAYVTRILPRAVVSADPAGRRRRPRGPAPCGGDRRGLHPHLARLPRRALPPPSREKPQGVTAQPRNELPNSFDLHGYVTVSVESGAPAERQLREMFRPFLVDHLDGPADIVVGEPGPPLSRASHGEHAFRFTDESVDVVADRVRVTVRPDGYEVRGKGELLTSVLPIVERVGVERGAAMVHAATIAIGDAGVCLPALGRGRQDQHGRAADQPAGGPVHGRRLGLGRQEPAAAGLRQADVPQAAPPRALPARVRRQQQAARAVGDDRHRGPARHGRAPGDHPLPAARGRDPPLVAGAHDGAPRGRVPAGEDRHPRPAAAVLLRRALRRRTTSS